MADKTWFLGEAKPIRYQLDASSAFTLSSATCRVTNAAGTEVATGSAQILRPGTASQELQFEFTAPAVGRYKVIFTVGVGPDTYLFKIFLDVFPP